MDLEVTVDNPHSDVDADTLQQLPTSVGVVGGLLPRFAVGLPGGPILVPPFAGWMTPAQLSAVQRGSCRCKRSLAVWDVILPAAAESSSNAATADRSSLSLEQRDPDPFGHFPSPSVGGTLLGRVLRSRPLGSSAHRCCGIGSSGTRPGAFVDGLDSADSQNQQHMTPTSAPDSRRSPGVRLAPSPVPRRSDPARRRSPTAQPSGPADPGHLGRLRLRGVRGRPTSGLVAAS